LLIDFDYGEEEEEEEMLFEDLADLEIVQAGSYL